jgi:hypothetical protein
VNKKSCEDLCFSSTTVHETPRIVRRHTFFPCSVFHLVTLRLASGGVTIFCGDYGSDHPSKVRNTLLIHEPCQLWRLRPRYRTPPAAAIFSFFFSFGCAQVHPSICRFLPSVPCYEWTFLILHLSWHINKYIWVCEFRLMSVCSLLFPYMEFSFSS